MPSPVWMSGSELATIWVSRIAKNIPTAMATNPTQVLIPTPPADNGAAVILGLSPPSPRGEDTERWPDGRGDSGQKKGGAREPRGVQQNEEWVALGIRLDGTLPAQPGGIAVRPAEFDAALQQDQNEAPVEHGHRLSSTRK